MFNTHTNMCYISVMNEEKAATSETDMRRRWVINMFVVFRLQLQFGRSDDKGPVGVSETDPGRARQARLCLQIWMHSFYLYLAFDNVMYAHTPITHTHTSIVWTRNCKNLIYRDMPSNEETTAAAFCLRFFTIQRAKGSEKKAERQSGLSNVRFLQRVQTSQLETQQTIYHLSSRTAATTWW